MWVRTATGQTPGLLLAWDRDAQGVWWGRVVISTPEAVAVEQLFRADLLRPADPEPAPLQRQG